MVCNVQYAVICFSSKLAFQEHNLLKNRAGGIQMTNYKTQQLKDLSRCLWLTLEYEKSERKRNTEVKDEIVKEK